MKKVLLLFAVLLVVMTAAMTAITRRMLFLERQEQLQALREENERLALWRLESYVLPIVLRESGLNYDLLLRDSLTQQPLPQEVLCYFRGNEQTALEAITMGDTTGSERLRPAAQVHTASTSKLTRELQQLVLNSAWLDAFDTAMAASRSSMIAPEVEASSLSVAARQQVAQKETQSEASQQIVRSQNEFLSRKGNAFSNSIILEQMPWQTNLTELKTFTPMYGFWVDQRLYLARRLEAGGTLRKFEGCVLDWQQLEHDLLERIADLLPAAQLVPLLPGDEPDHHSLANLPLRLIPGVPTLAGLSPKSMLQPTLVVAWTCFMIGALAVGILAVGVSRLSERRATFVSSVTHELRTPLTTFRLYADLLGSPALPEPKRARYLETLKLEAERLQYLIENVLSWSGLERTADTHRLETLNWSEELASVEPILRERLGQAGMLLHVELHPDMHMRTGPRFRGNRTALERILFNLIDNSCKYARSGDKRVGLLITADDTWLRFRVYDTGPGISPEMRRRLFKPFSKSAEQAARTAPGIGLGLSLSRRLARAMHGDLQLVRSDAIGTEFELRLRLA